MKQPVLSIVTITYNASVVIGATLRSVASQRVPAAAEQPAFEHLIVDGASTDDTLRFVEAGGTDAVRVVSEPDRGIYDAMNKALRLAEGDYVMFLNAGDAFADSDCLARIVSTLRRARPLIAYGQTDIVDEQRQVTGHRHLTAPERLSWRDFKRGMLVCHQAFVVKRAIAPLYDLNYRYSADYDWCLKCLREAQRLIDNGEAQADAIHYLGDEPIIHFLDGGTTTAHHRASLWERYRLMCRHYGVITATLQHLSFIPRLLSRLLR